MLSALAPSGPVAPAVQTSPPSTTDSTQPTQRDSFKDVYGSVASKEESESDTGPKQKAAESTGAKSKKGSADNQTDKTAVVVAADAQMIVLQKAPLTFAIASLDQQGSQPTSDESPSATEGQPQSVTQSEGDGAGRTGIPNFSVPVGKPGQTAATALVPANEKLAFSARLTQPDAPQGRVQTPKPSVPQPSRLQANNQTRTMTGPASPSTAKDPYQTVDVKKIAGAETVLPSREISSTSVIDLRQTGAPPPQFSEPVHVTPARSLAVQDVQPMPPEIPKPPASTEILLQLAGKDQSTASVRVIDRSGTVNVTVHAADPDLRNSLRSNLSDLASQLTGQGFKTEVVRPAMMAANAENQRDSRHGGQDSPTQQQHHSPQDSRQPQRDHRGNPESWLNELEQETSGISGAPGGIN